MCFNEFQKKIIETYSDGDFNHITTKEEVNEAGDTLFRFLIIETATSEDCDSFTTAYKRIETSIKKLQIISEHFMCSALMQEDIDSNNAKIVALVSALKSARSCIETPGDLNKEEVRHVLSDINCALVSYENCDD